MFGRETAGDSTAHNVALSGGNTAIIAARNFVIFIYVVSRAKSLAAPRA